jgi:hypothetical protein
MTKLTTALATSIALIATASIADAKDGRHDNNNQKRATPHFVITGQPASVKRVILGERKEMKEKKDKHADKKHEKDKLGKQHDKDKHAEKRHDKEKKEKKDGSTGKTQPPSPKQESGNKPSPAAKVVTLSNGVTTSVIETGKGLTITSSAPGMITVSNGTNSVTMAGGSLTLKGAASVSVPAGYQAVRLTNGDFSVAVSPVIANGSGQSRPVPPGVGATDTLKSGAAFYGSFGAYPAAVGAASVMSAPAIVGGIAGGDVKGTIKDLGNFVEDAANWATGWF